MEPITKTIEERIETRAVELMNDLLDVHAQTDASRIARAQQEQASGPRSPNLASVWTRVCSLLQSMSPNDLD